MSLSVVAHAYKLNTQEVEVRELGVQGHLELHIQFKDSLSYRVRPCPKTNKRKEQDKRIVPSLRPVWAERDCLKKNKGQAQGEGWSDKGADELSSSLR